MKTTTTVRFLVVVELDAVSQVKSNKSATEMNTINRIHSFGNANGMSLFAPFETTQMWMCWVFKRIYTFSHIPCQRPPIGTKQNHMQNSTNPSSPCNWQIICVNRAMMVHRLNKKILNKIKFQEFE
jgi:hypothetical protein